MISYRLRVIGLKLCAIFYSVIAGKRAPVINSLSPAAMRKTITLPASGSHTCFGSMVRLFVTSNLFGLKETCWHHDLAYFNCLTVLALINAPLYSAPLFFLNESK